MQEAQKGACSTISASQPLLLRDCFRLSISDKSESVNLLLHWLHLSCGRSCSGSRDTLDLWDPGCNANPFSKWIVKTQWLLEDNRYILSWLGIHSAKKWHFGSLWWSWDEKLFSDVWTGQNRVQFVEIPTHQVYQLPINISDLLCGAGKVFTRHRLDNPVNHLEHKQL